MEGTIAGYETRPKAGESAFGEKFEVLSGDGVPFAVVTEWTESEEGTLFTVYGTHDNAVRFLLGTKHLDSIAAEVRKIAAEQGIA